MPALQSCQIGTRLDDGSLLLGHLQPAHFEHTTHISANLDQSPLDQPFFFTLLFAQGKMCLGNVTLWSVIVSHQDFP